MAVNILVPRPLNFMTTVSVNCSNILLGPGR